MITVFKTKLKDVVRIDPDVFKDHRGYYLETYNKDLYKQHGINIDFVQDDIAVSQKWVLRGLHGDNRTWKLVSCLRGEFYLVVLNYDTTSPQYGVWESFILSAENRYQVLIPPKHVNGHLILSDMAMFHYKQSTYYNRESQYTVMWNAKEFDIWWPIATPILSERDLGKAMPVLI
jgi:dTDP-4-dehydrorhamnose 3,5-epimerase